MEGPAVLEMPCDRLLLPARSVAHPSRHHADELGPSRNVRSRSGMIQCRGDQPQELIGLFLKDQVAESPLDLGPFVPLTRTQACRVLIKCLMKNAHNHKGPVSTRCGKLRERLEELDITTRRILGGILEDLAGLVH